MKIIIIQLARFGDNLLTRPAVSALRRAHPEAEIHVLCRSTFREAWTGCFDIDYLTWLDSFELINALVGENGIPSALTVLQDTLRPLVEQKFDRIVNLTYSPLSSFLTHLIWDNDSVVSGYTRFDDGFLNIPDDPSAYFFAQVGVHKSNRLHISHIFGAVCSVDLTPEDWKVDFYSTDSKIKATQDDVLIHIGASQKQKNLSPDKWNVLVHRLAPHVKGRIYLIGGKQDQSIGDYIKLGHFSDRIVNLAGQTRVSDLLTLSAQAGLVIGCDSLMIHVASLTRTPTVALSVGPVNLYETSPLTPESLILRADSEDELFTEHVVQHALLVLEKKNTAHIRSKGVFKIIDSCVEILPLFSDEATYAWRLIKALYMDAQFPRPESRNTTRGFTELHKLSHLALEQLASWGGPGKMIQSEIIKRVDEMIRAVSNLVPEVKPAVEWFETEKLRTPPGKEERIMARATELYGKFASVCDVCAGFQNENEAADVYQNVV